MIWKQKHDEGNNFHESFDGEHTLKGTVETKYLGCILSNDGTNAMCTTSSSLFRAWNYTCMVCHKTKKINVFKTQHENSIIKKVFNAQIKSPLKRDWASEVIDILKELNIEKGIALKDIEKN